MWESSREKTIGMEWSAGVAVQLLSAGGVMRSAGGVVRPAGGVVRSAG